MSDWSDAVEVAIKRSRKEDKGAVAAKEGILGQELTQTGEKAERCYAAASKARNGYQAARKKRNLPELPPGTTGNSSWDKKLLETIPT